MLVLSVFSFTANSCSHSLLIALYHCYSSTLLCVCVCVHTLLPKHSLTLSPFTSNSALWLLFIIAIARNWSLFNHRSSLMSLLASSTLSLTSLFHHHRPLLCLLNTLSLTLSPFTSKHSPFIPILHLSWPFSLVKVEGEQSKNSLVLLFVVSPLPFTLLCKQNLQGSSLAPSLLSCPSPCSPSPFRTFYKKSTPWRTTKGTPVLVP